MTEALFSPSWYRVAPLTPRLRGHTRVYRHDYRGEIWYVLQDPSSGRYYRFSPAAYEILGRMDGTRTVQQLWDAACERLGDDGPTQHEVVQLLGQLHSADVMLSGVPPDTDELVKRSEKTRRSKLLQVFKSPLAVRFPLLDPERFLERTISYVRPLFGVAGALLWLAVVATALVLVGLHWGELTEGVLDRVLSAQNLVAMAFVYPLVKALHELGHGYATKAWGGEVHEMGIMLLVLMPIPYVDASAASEFRSKQRRLVVGAGGMLVELLLASVAMFVWLALEPGVARSFCYNVMLIGGVSTILFNGNPLLRFDGYYILADLLEIPNLGQRGQKYVGYLFKRHAFRMKREKAPMTAPGERFWFVVYTVSAFAYRGLIYTGIILFIAGKFFVVGILLAAWAAFSMIILPTIKGVRFVLTSPSLRENRGRAVVLTTGLLALIMVVLFVLPFPYRTRGEATVWVPEESLVRAATSGFVVDVVARPNARVARGEVLVTCHDPLLLADVRVVRARLAELRARYVAASASDKVQQHILEEEISAAERELARAEERLAELTLRSPGDGVFVLPGAADMPDRYLKQGELVAYVLDIDRPIVRAVVPQSRVDLVRQRTLEVEVRLAERLDEVRLGTLIREVPGAVERLPSTVLGTSGGGEISIDPRDESQTRALDKTFQFDIELVEPVSELFVGGRVYVRFDHGVEPIGLQWYRSIRQLFLKRFNV